MLRNSGYQQAKNEAKKLREDITIKPYTIPFAIVINHFKKIDPINFKKLAKDQYGEYLKENIQKYTKFMGHPDAQQRCVQIIGDLLKLAKCANHSMLLGMSPLALFDESLLGHAITNYRQDVDRIILARDNKVQPADVINHLCSQNILSLAGALIPREGVAKRGVVIAQKAALNNQEGKEAVPQGAKIIPIIGRGRGRGKVEDSGKGKGKEGI